MNYTISLIKGDGIGPEIKYGEPLPKESLDKCINSDAVLICNICGSKWSDVIFIKKQLR